MANLLRKLIGGLSVVALLCAGFSAGAVAETESGTIVIDETQVMLIAGGDFGGGTLTTGGKAYKFKTGGLKLGGVGIHKVKLSGEVYDLKDVADFPGVYGAVEAGVTIVKGKDEILLKNDKGVTIKMKSKSEGVALNLGVEGMKITME